MKTKEIRELTNEELAAELERVRRHVFDLRSQAVTEKLEDPNMVTNAKRDIARILTIQREREIETAGAGESTTASGTNK